jgi:hypothetical protein
MTAKAADSRATAAKRGDRVFIGFSKNGGRGRDGSSGSRRTPRKSSNRLGVTTLERAKRSIL